MVQPECIQVERESDHKNGEEEDSARKKEDTDKVNDTLHCWQRSFNLVSSLAKRSSFFYYTSRNSFRKPLTMEYQTEAEKKVLHITPPRFVALSLRSNDI